MFLSQIWRYPVKSMGGERLERCDLSEDGVPGDRIVHVEDARGRVVTSRSKPRLLLHHASLGPDGEPLVDGRPWRDAAVAKDVLAAGGEGAHLESWTGPERFDILPLLIATDGAINALGYDARRFRANLIIGDVEGFTERSWEGRRLAIGKAVVFAVDLRERCIMTTWNPDDASQDVEVLKRIRRELDGTFALNCRVEEPGAISAGDDVRLVT
jgi:uncharacterized protein YcbX